MTEPERIYVKPGVLPGVKPEEATEADLLKVRDEYTKQVIPPEGGWVKLTRLVRRRLAAKDLVKADAPSAASAGDSPAAPAAEGSEESPSAEVATTEEAPADVSPAPSEGVSADAEGTDVRRRRRREGEG